ncbi:MAG: recombinase family protein [Alphaproteobacteria bacterium]|nr:recombinase family protein [Alphaproteobacteria bacterium]
MAGFEAGSRLIGYARVSTADQRLDMQLDALKRAGCENIFADHGVSGAVGERPALSEAVNALKSGDTLVVYKLDRLGRSVHHLADLLKRFEDDGVHFCSLTEGINTGTSGGKLVFHVFAAVAQFQRDLIAENTICGLEAARRRGSRIGRPYALNDALLIDAHRFIVETGGNITDAARQFGVPRATLDRGLDRLGLKDAA